MQNTKELTKREALRICGELWDWLAKTGAECKDDWPGWDKYGEMENNCPCCTYSNQSYVFPDYFFSCKNCPIKWISNKYKNSSNYDDFYPDCQQDPSPFHKWEEADNKEERKAAARKVKALAVKALYRELSK